MSEYVYKCYNSFKKIKTKPLGNLCVNFAHFSFVFNAGFKSCCYDEMFCFHIMDWFNLIYVLLTKYMIL